MKFNWTIFLNILNILGLLYFKALFSLLLRFEQAPTMSFIRLFVSLGHRKSILNFYMLNMFPRNN